MTVASAIAAEIMGQDEIQYSLSESQHDRLHGAIQAVVEKHLPTDEEELLKLERDRLTFDARAHALRIAADLALKEGYSAQTDTVIERAARCLAFLEGKAK